jgi:ribosomal subunit interface protein
MITLVIPTELSFISLKHHFIGIIMVVLVRKTMDIIIQSLGFTASENLENFIHEKFGKFEKEESKIIRANVTLFIGPDSTPSKYYCEIRLEVPGNDHFTKKNSDSFEKAITDAVDTIQHTLRKAKKKQIDRNQGNVT